MKKDEAAYLLLAIIAAELVIIYPMFFPKHDSTTRAVAETSIRETHHPYERHPAQSQSKVPEAPPLVSSMAHSPRSSVGNRDAPPALRIAMKQARASPPKTRTVPPPTSKRPERSAAIIAHRHYAQTHIFIPALAHEPFARHVTGPKRAPQKQQAVVVALAMPSTPRSKPRNAAAAIDEFDATATHLVRGQTTFLCVGVEPGTIASIAGLGRIRAGRTSCHRVAPKVTTTYVLTVEQHGATAVRNLRIYVRPAKFGAASAKKPARGSHRFYVPN